MVSGIENIIEEVRIYNCGYCINKENLIYKNGKKINRKFPALVLLIKHRKKGHILVDTGYSEKIYENGITSSIYNGLNKTIFLEEDRIDCKLKRDKIDIKDINSVILTHLHPDHIGAIHLFKKSKIYISKLATESAQSKNIFKVLFKNMINELNYENFSFIEDYEKINDENLKKYFDFVYDIIGDQSIYVIPLKGHAKEQIGVLIKEHNIFFIADASWNSNELNREIKVIPRRIQDNYEDYRKTLSSIIAFKNDFKGLKIIASHDELKEGILLYEGKS